MYSIKRIDEIDRKFGEQFNTKFTFIQAGFLECLRIVINRGDRLSRIQNTLEPATKNKPVLTDMGEFTSFEDFISKSGRDRYEVYKYLKLYKEKEKLESIGLFIEDNAEHYSKILTTGRIFSIVKWVDAQLESGRSLSDISVLEYWRDIK